jgi:lipid A disaccharide synthetase
MAPKPNSEVDKLRKEFVDVLAKLMAERDELKIELSLALHENKRQQRAFDKLRDQYEALINKPEVYS